VRALYTIHSGDGEMIPQKHFFLISAVLVTTLFFTYFNVPASSDKRRNTMKITSKAFSHMDSIPRKYTCDGEDISPPISWEGVPEGTKSLALIVDDPDAPDPRAPKMTWVHWVLYNIPPNTKGLEEDIDVLPEGTLEGLNDWKRTGYGGPCPPIGRHRYFFKLYALDIMLPDLKMPTKKAVEEAMKGHVLERAELIGTYER